MPVGRLLVHVGGPQQAFFFERRGLAAASRSADPALLNPQGKAMPPMPARLRADGVQVYQIHRQRIVDFFADLERRRGGDWTGDQVDLLKGIVVIVAESDGGL